MNTWIWHQNTLFFWWKKKRNLPNIKKCRSLDTINLMSKILQCEGPLPAGHLGCEWFIPCTGQFIRKNPALVMVRETSVAPDVALTQFFSHMGSIPPCVPKIKKKKRFWSSKDSTKNHGIFRTHTPPHGRFFLARPGTCRQCSHLGHQAQCRCWPDNPSHSLFRECLEPPNFCWLVGLCWIECIEILPILS